MISLISRVLSDDSGNEPIYVHDGDLTGDAGFTYLAGPNVKEITYNGNIKFVRDFTVSTTQPGPGLLFTYHGSSIDLGSSVAVYNNFAAGPTTVKMTGDSLTARGR